MSDVLVIGLYVLTLVPFAASAALYGFRSPWRDHPVGRVLAGLLASICTVLVFAVVVRLLGAEGLLVTVLRFVFLSCVSLAGWALLWQIVRIQREQPTDHPRRRATDI